MSKCIRCGDLTGFRGSRICQHCMKKWLNQQTAAYDVVMAEMGHDSPQNHEMFVKRLKQVKKKLAAAIRKESDG